VGVSVQPAGPVLVATISGRGRRVQHSLIRHGDGLLWGGGGGDAMGGTHKNMDQWAFTNYEFGRTKRGGGGGQSKKKTPNL